MQENARTFAWTKRRRLAALRVAEDDVSDEAIATEVGINPATLWRWKQCPEFAAQVGDDIGQIQAGMLKLTIAKKHRRVAVLDMLHEQTLALIAAAGVDVALIREIRELQLQAAKELGQWTERLELDQRTNIVELINADPGDI